MTMGTARRKGNFGYYNIGGRILYFNKKPTEKDIQQALKKAEAEESGLTQFQNDCGGACCADQERIIN
jgi:hypothetical protein